MEADLKSWGEALSLSLASQKTYCSIFRMVTMALVKRLRAGIAMDNPSWCENAK